MVIFNGDVWRNPLFSHRYNIHKVIFYIFTFFVHPIFIGYMALKLILTLKNKVSVYSSGKISAPNVLLLG